MSITEVSEYIRLPVRTLYQYRVDGRGPRGITVGRYVRYRRADVDAWLNKQADQRPPAA